MKPKPKKQVYNTKQGILHDPVFQKILLIIVITKAFMFLVAYFAATNLPYGAVYNYNISNSVFLNNWAQYDAAAYIDIAKNGYNAEYMNGYGNYNWFPLYPMLIAGLGFFIGYALAAFLLSNIAFFIAVWLLYLLLKEEFSKSVAYRSIFFILLFPTTYFFTAMYTESLFLLLLALCFYFAKKSNWLAVGICGFFAALTRLQGVVIFVPMVYEYLKQKGIFKEKFSINTKFKIKSIDPSYLSFLYLLLIPLGVLVFMIYDYFMFGSALKFLDIPLFNRHLALPFTGVIFELGQLFKPLALVPLDLKAYIIFTLAIITVFGVLAVLSFKYLEPRYSIFIALNYIIPLCSNRLEAESRYYLILFPAFLLIALLEEKNREKQRKSINKFRLLRLDILMNILLVLSVILMAVFVVWHTRGGKFW